MEGRRSKSHFNAARTTLKEEFISTQNLLAEIRISTGYFDGLLWET